MIAHWKMMMSHSYLLPLHAGESGRKYNFERKIIMINPGQELSSNRSPPRASIQAEWLHPVTRLELSRWKVHLLSMLQRDEWQLGTSFINHRPRRPELQRPRLRRTLRTLQNSLRQSVVVRYLSHPSQNIDFNKKPTILREITHISFPYLRTIYLGDNNITNVEAIQVLNSPNLELLHLNHNMISEGRVLRKNHSPKLLHLGLGGNLIKQLSWVTCCSFPLLDRFSFSYNKAVVSLYSLTPFSKSVFMLRASFESERLPNGSMSRLDLLSTIMKKVNKEKEKSQALEGNGRTTNGSGSKHRNLFKTFES